MFSELKKIAQQAAGEIEKIETENQLRDIEIYYLGRKGALTNQLKKLKDIPEHDRAEMGSYANLIKREIEERISKKKRQIEEKTIQQKLEQEWIDVTAPGKKLTVGHIHPISQVQAEVEHIFTQMGFAIMDGPEVESEYYNFETLNIPAHHPARDMQDTFFLNQKEDKKHGKLVLRTQTSPVQIRAMEKYGAPLRIIVPGRVFRNEATDARHEHTFDQVEGLLIDKDISLAHLKGIMREFLNRLFGENIDVRFRPGYFPFVEPGLELDCRCLLCSDKKGGCRVCKYTGWLEFMGAGIVHPNVLKAGGIDPNIYQGWAFGFGLTRLVMLRYGIDDIRLLMSGDLRFLEQF